MLNPIALLLISALSLVSSFSVAHGAVHGTGHYDVDVVPLTLPSDQVKALLPEGLELASEVQAGGVPAGRHLVLLTFGYQRRVSPRPVPLWSWSYHEFTATVPFVRFTGGDGKIFHHLFRLYLDHHRAILAGRAYGFPKLYSTVYTGTFDFGPRRERTYDLTSRDDGSNLIRAVFSHEAAREPRLLRELPNFGIVSEVFGTTSAPLVQKSAEGHWICADFLWETAEAKGFPIDATVTSHVEELGYDAVYRTEGLDRTPWGAFRMSVDWTLSTPRACPRPRPGS